MEELRMNAPPVARDDRIADSNIADVAMIRYASVSRVIGESQIAGYNIEPKPHNLVNRAVNISYDFANGRISFILVTISRCQPELVCVFLFALERGRFDSRSERQS